MSIGREGAICEVIEIMQISPVRAMKLALIAASRTFCKLDDRACSLLSLSSCPGLSRASTSFGRRVDQDVDGRDKPGHDGELASTRSKLKIQKFQPLPHAEQ
jgi:hypothetical protein